MERGDGGAVYFGIWSSSEREIADFEGLVWELGRRPVQWGRKKGSPSTVCECDPTVVTNNMRRGGGGGDIETGPNLNPAEEKALHQRGERCHQALAFFARYRAAGVRIG